MNNRLAAATLAGAALFGLPAAAAPVFDIPAADAFFVAFDGVGDLVFEAEAIFEDIGAPDDLSAFFALSFDVADPYATAAATFDLSNADGLFLGGVASLIDFSEDLLVLTFSGLDGSAAAAFGSTLTFELFFVDAVGADPLAGLDDGGIYSVAGVGVGVGSEDVAPVPLPATGSLLLAVLGSAAGLSFMRRTCVG